MTKLYYIDGDNCAAKERLNDVVFNFHPDKAWDIFIYEFSRFKDFHINKINYKSFSSYGSADRSLEVKTTVIRRGCFFAKKETLEITVEDLFSVNDFTDYISLFKYMENKIFRYRGLDKILSIETSLGTFKLCEFETEQKECKTTFGFDRGKKDGDATVGCVMTRHADGVMTVDDIKSWFDKPQKQSRKKAKKTGAKK